MLLKFIPFRTFSAAAGKVSCARVSSHYLLMAQ